MTTKLLALAVANEFRMRVTRICARRPGTDFLRLFLNQTTRYNVAGIILSRTLTLPRSAGYRRQPPMDGAHEAEPLEATDLWPGLVTVTTPHLLPYAS